MLLLPLLALALGVTALPQQQLPLGRFPSLSSSLSPTLLEHPAFLSLDSALQSLSLEHHHLLQDHIDALPEKRTVQLLTGGQGTVETTEGEKALLTLQNVRFVDVTDDLEGVVEGYTKSSYPSKLKHTSEDLDSVFKHISLPEMKLFITEFSGFYNRYYRSNYGRQSQQWLLAHLQNLHQTLSPHSNITFREFKHSTWEQRSIILRWDPPSSSANSADEPVIILGAHQDSTNSLPFLRAPGADDDGSGVMALIQLLSSLMKAGWEPSHPIETHLFSAEEGGLLGSGEIAREYRTQGRKVEAMWHMDVVAYVKPGTTPVIGLITDNADAALVDFMKLVIGEYAEIPVAETQTNYPASDYGSWTKNGYPAVCTAEGKFADSNPNMHSTADVWDRPEYSFEHVQQFVRVGLGFVTELAGFRRV